MYKYNYYYYYIIIINKAQYNTIDPKLLCSPIFKKKS